MRRAAERPPPPDDPQGLRRRLEGGDASRDVELQAGQVRWIGAQRHRGDNIGDTSSHAFFVELRDGAAAAPSAGTLGPA